MCLALHKEQIKESIEILGADSYFEVSHYFGGGPGGFGCYIRLTAYGLDRYCSSEIDNYEQLKEQCAGLIVNEDVHDSSTLAARTDTKIRLIEHILDLFELNGLIKVSKYVGGNMSIHHISAKFRRMLL